MLKIEGLHKRYGQVIAVDGVDVDVPAGRIVGFIGPNGAGKSTTMRSIFGLVRPEAGTITWQGEPIGADALSRFGYMPEQRGLYPKMKILDQVAYFAELKGQQRTEARTRAAALLGELGLEDRLGDPLEALSHGNQQRVQLAVSMVHDPEMMVLDEPFNGLDPVAVGVLQEVLATRARRGVGVLFSSHQLELVEQLCDDVVIIATGTIRARGSVPDVRRSLGHNRVVVSVDRPLFPLAEALGAFAIAHATTREVRLDVADESRLDEVLAAARTAGIIDSIRFEPPTLTEVFAAVTGRDGGVDQ